MVNFTILAGGYANFVASYLFDTDMSTLTLLNQSPSGINCSWITAGYQNKSILYMTNEVTDGMLQSYVIGAEGAVTGPVDQVSSGGSGPAFTAQLSNGQVAIMNYNTGDGKVISTSPDGLYFDYNAPLITFPLPPPGIGEGVSHPHMAYEYSSEVFVPDLGGDVVWRLGQPNLDGNWSIHGSVEQPNSSGPRHMQVYNNELYVIHELASTVTVQTVPSYPDGTDSLIANVSILPPVIPEGAMMAAAEILIPAPTLDFPVPYIYTSNRNTGVQDPRGDAISVFERTATGLELVGQVYTGLDQIRGMMIGPDDVRGGSEYLIAGGVAGTAGVVMLRRIDGGRNLEIVATNTDIPTRTSFVWLYD